MELTGAERRLLKRSRKNTSRSFRVSVYAMYLGSAVLLLLPAAWIGREVCLAAMGDWPLPFIGLCAGFCGSQGLGMVLAALVGEPRLWRREALLLRLAERLRELGELRPFNGQTNAEQESGS